MSPSEVKLRHGPEPLAPLCRAAYSLESVGVARCGRLFFADYPEIKAQKDNNLQLPSALCNWIRMHADFSKIKHPRVSRHNTVPFDPEGSNTVKINITSRGGIKARHQRARCFIRALIGNS